MRHHDLLLDVLNHNSTITACDKGWQWPQALGLLEGMRHNYLLPDVISCSSARIDFERGGKWKGDVCQGKGGYGNGKAFFFAQREEGERPKEAPLWVSENPLFS